MPASCPPAPLGTRQRTSLPTYARSGLREWRSRCQVPDDRWEKHPALLRPLEDEVEVLAPGGSVILRRLPATHDPVWPDVSDEPLEHVGVLATQVPMRAVECHGVDPADTSFVVVE